MHQERNLKQNLLRRQPGFTLVEILLYISLASIIMLAISALMMSLIQVRNRTEVIESVNAEGSRIANIIYDSFNQAESVSAPVAAASGTSLTIETVNLNTDPIIISIASGALQISENGTVTRLSSNRVTASNLQIKNMTAVGTKSSVSIQFTLSHANPGANDRFSYQQTFYVGASVR